MKLEVHDPHQDIRDARAVQLGSLFTEFRFMCPWHTPALVAMCWGYFSFSVTGLV